MKKGTGTAITFAVGVFAGIALCGPAAQAATVSLTAAPTSQTFYVNGQRVQFEAYEIHGNNFVKLRDIGQAVDFAVDYEGSTNSVHINSALPYQKEVIQPAPAAPAPSAPAVTTSPATGGYTITADHWSREDFSRQANPGVFTGVYDRALYNTIRQTLVDGEPGDAPAYTTVAKGADYSAVKNLIGRMSGLKRYEHYTPKDFTNYWQYLDYFALSADVPENYQEALNFIQPAITQASQLSTDREKVEYLHDYLCTLLAYDVSATAGIPQTFAPHVGELKAACGSYAVAFKFLCQAADIPCISVSSSSHTWNMVYADGRWLYVDVSADDLRQNKNALLVEIYPRHTDIASEATAFLQELLVPGSTK